MVTGSPSRTNDRVVPERTSVASVTAMVLATVPGGDAVSM